MDSLGRFYSFRGLDGPVHDPVVCPSENGPLSKVLNSFLGRNQASLKMKCYSLIFTFFFFRFII